MAFWNRDRDEGARVVHIPLGEITPNPHQPRLEFPREELEDLARSIAQVGILQPLTVRRTPQGYELIAGERRLRAAKLAGLSQVPCLVITADEERSSLLALVENIQRQDLHFLDEALALRQMMDTFGLSQEEAARRVGRSQPAVANKLRLLRLPPDVLQRLRESGLTERHARALLRLTEPQVQREVLEHIISRRLTVAKTETYIDRLLRPRQRQCAPTYLIRDVRLFLNTVQKGLNIMQAAGVAAQCGREETEEDILLTIRIPKSRRPGQEARRESPQPVHSDK